MRRDHLPWAHHLHARPHLHVHHALPVAMPSSTSYTDTGTIALAHRATFSSVWGAMWRYYVSGTDILREWAGVYVHYGVFVAMFVEEWEDVSWRKKRLYLLSTYVCSGERT